jgi:histidyl-tRNA synthetase
VKFNPRLQNPHGTEDIFGVRMRRRQHVLGIVETVYRSFGFQPLHTPVLENADVFDGHHGEGEKLLFNLTDSSGNPLVLRYDLTVPLARFMGMHPEIPRPFKRYQIAPSFRDDKVDHGHFREFIQCDGDVVGIPDLTADAEVIAMADMGLRSIGFNEYVIRVNHRGIIRGLAEYACGTGCDVLEIQRALDYADKAIKQGIDGVRADLRRRNLKEKEIERLAAVLCFSGTPYEVLENATSALSGFPDAESGIAELRKIFGYLDESVRGRVSVDFTLARGADYYTGFILEAVIPGIPVGAVLGGGRYDNLMNAAGGTGEPAVGMAFGLERILTAMEELSMDAQNSGQTVLVFSETPLEEGGDAMKNLAFDMAKHLRANGLMIDYNPGPISRAEAEAYAKTHDYAVLCGINRSGVVDVGAFKECHHHLAEQAREILDRFDGK